MSIGTPSEGVGEGLAGGRVAGRESMVPLGFFGAGGAAGWLRNPRVGVNEKTTEGTEGTETGDGRTGGGLDGQRGEEVYLRDGAVRGMLGFFEAKGLATLKAEDRGEEWYGDWIGFQRERGIYGELLLPARYSGRGGCFDLLRYARFLEVFAYCGPAHGYSLQVSFLGFFSILLGTNEALKREAAAALEAGGLLAFGVSERGHGSDLMANEFTVAEVGARLVANGSKYYIGNADHAAMISVLGKKVGEGGRASRMPLALVALRPETAAGFKSLGKIHTLGVRAADVGAFEVTGHHVAAGDVIAEGRDAWDAVFGTVTLGKFFLGFGSIGMCERAFEEAVAHLRARVLYGKPALEMGHIRAAMRQAYARLTAMKLYAYRALDYVHAASAADRRYLLFCAVQKAKVSTEGVKVMALLSECMGAKGFESDTFFEMALRDVALIPGLEGSMHINLGQAVQYVPRYFDGGDEGLGEAPSLVGGEVVSRENGYLMEARTGGVRSIGFRPFLEAYHPLRGVGNVALFARQAAAFRRISTREDLFKLDRSDLQVTMLMGQCVATIAYGQLVAEAAVRLEMPGGLVSVMFGLLVEDLAGWARQLAALPGLDEAGRAGVMGMVRVSRTGVREWEVVGENF